jgi:hypothetical protein
MTMIFAIVFAMVMVVATTSCGGDERRAERLWRRANERMEKGETQEAVDDLQKIITAYPDARIAAKARERIVVYRGLATAVQSYPSRRARELMVQIARAIEREKRDKGRAPASLDELVPSRFATVPVDPWGRPFGFEATARGYRISCLGADGAPGGDGDGADLLVVDGEFVAASR